MVAFRIGVFVASAALVASLGRSSTFVSSHAAAGAAVPSAPKPPALTAITEADIKRDMFALGGDAFRGREAGTLDEMRASMWVADRAREAGLEPAGDDGSYFQWWSIRRTRLSDASRVAVGGRQLVLWRDVVPMANLTATVDLPLVWLTTTDSATLRAMDLRGKAVGVMVPAPATTPEPPPGGPTLSSTGAANQAVTRMTTPLTTQLTALGVAAILLVNSDDRALDAGLTRTAASRMRGTYGVDSVRPANAPAPVANTGGGRGRGNAGPQIPVLWARHDVLDAAHAPDARLSVSLAVASFTYPSVNIVGRVRGTHRTRRDEYVLFSGHQDHDGVRYDVNGDSIWNGADDNASVAVALLAIARAVKKQPMERSALFVWHGAEERGLLGSRWYAGHPTVPQSSIVAVLNGDMIGRNHPDTAALLGVQPPHLNSKALVAAAYEANAMTTRFVIDTSWDNPQHREGWYFRSDHLPYARANIPAVFFSTLLHPDYHTPRDNPDRIDIAKLTKMAKWMYATGWIIGMTAERPDLVPGFRLER